MSGCLFCAIAEGTVGATVVYEDATAFAFRDINPQAPLHVLVIPRRHVASAAELVSGEDGQLWFHLLEVAQAVARTESVAADGYRLVTNIGAAAGQTVPHLHLHLLGGRAMTWPPG